MAEEKSKTLSDKDVVQLVNADHETAVGAPGGEVSLDREKAYKYYLQEPMGNEEEGRSAVVSADVAETVDGYMPSLMRIFTTADNVVSFDATKAMDEAQAQQESDYVSHIFFKRNPSFEIIFFWCFDALVRKTGIVKCYWDESEEVSWESYTGLTEQEHLAKLQDEELSVEEKEEKTIDMMDPNTGEAIKATTYDVKYKRVSKEGKVVVENVPPDEYRISQDANGLSPGSGRMVGQEREVTRSTLLEMGFPKTVVNTLTPDPLEKTSERNARNNKSDDQRTGDSGTPVPRDKSQDLFVLRETYKKMDVDGDGIAELMQVFSVGETLLSKEPIDRQVFHTLCPAPLPHKHIGRSLADKAMDIQEFQTELQRQVLDNLYQTNNPGHGVWEQGMSETTLDDLLTRDIGNVTIFRRPVAESYTPMTVPFTASESFPMIDFMSRKLRDRTGISSDSEGLTPDSLKNIQQSVMSQSMDLSRMKVELVARIFAETGFKSLFRHIHELVQKNRKKEDVFRLRGQYIEVNPANWRTREDMTVNVGLGIGTRDQNLMHLQMIGQFQQAMIDAGGMNLTVTPKNVFNTAAEMVKNANYKEPAMFFTDPGDQQAPPPSDEQQKLQQQQQALMQRQQQLDGQKQQLDKMKVDLDAQEMKTKADLDRLEYERKLQKDIDDANIKVEKLRNEITEMELKYNTNLPGGAK